jgi:hypothetical protein
MSAYTPEETAQRDSVRAALKEAINSAQTILMPDYRGNEGPGDFALQNVGLEPNAYGGTAQGLRYQFEGEEDLLHLFIVRADGGSATVEEAKDLAAWLLPEVPPGMIWLNAGRRSMHFHFGHELLVAEDD